MSRKNYQNFAFVHSRKENLYPGTQFDVHYSLCSEPTSKIVEILLCIYFADPIIIMLPSNQIEKRAQVTINNVKWKGF